MNTKTILHSAGLAACLLLLSSSDSFSQFKPQTLRVSMANEATALPSFRLTQAPLHPAFLIGTEFWVKSRKQWQQSLGADFTFYYHRLSEKALMLDAVYALGYQFKFGLQTKLLTGIGYKHSVLSGDVYRFDNGQYAKAMHWGKSQMNIKLGLGLEYPLNPKFSLTSEYKIMAVVPYSNFIPFSAHTFFGIGLKVKLNP